MSSILLVASTYLVNLLTKRDIKMGEIDILIKTAHEYSGLDPDSFYTFVTNINMFKTNLNDPESASTFLYTALECLENVGLASEYHEEIHELVKQIGYYAEKQLMNTSLNAGSAFHPKYLNSRLE
jgi:hypothetical protein